ncbi:diguanylate cyclase domain-containing protein [Sphingomonas qilianensis]
MTAILLVLGLKITTTLHDEVAWLALTAGLACSVVKLGLIAAFKHRATGRTELKQDQDHWGRAFALLSVGLALSLGSLGARTFDSHAVLLQMLATGLLFGYCSGLVAHTSIRPLLAAACLLMSTLPIAASAALKDDSTYQILAASLICFMLAALQSIRHLYQATIQQILTRQEMAALARVDPLTRLPNRLGLKEAFGNRVRQNGRDIAIHCIDLNGFKAINDQYGHATGDALLAQVSARVRAALQSQDTVARIGGDEFVIIQSAVHSESDAESFARTLVACITAPYEIDRRHINIGVSLGFVTAASDKDELDDLVASADAALYRAKQCGGGVACALSVTTGRHDTPDR